MTEQQTPPAYAQAVITQLADLIALAAPHSHISDHGRQAVLTRVTAARGLSADATERITELLPPLTADPTVGAYVGQLRQIAQGLT